MNRAATNAESINTAPIAVSVGPNDNNDSHRFVHTIVPISDARGSIIDRLFVYSERVEDVRGGRWKSDPRIV